MRYTLHASRDDAGSPSDEPGERTRKVVGVRFHRYRPDNAWEPAINLYEGPKQYFMVVDLAGARPEDEEQFALSVGDGVITVSGVRATPFPPEAGGTLRMHLMEIDHGRFSRTVELPRDVDVENISAKYRGGYLWIRLPKRVGRAHR